MYLHFKVSLLASGMWCGNEDVFFGYTVASQCEQQASNFHSIWGKKGCNENICIDYAVFFFACFSIYPLKKYTFPSQDKTIYKYITMDLKKTLDTWLS